MAAAIRTAPLHAREELPTLGRQPSLPVDVRIRSAPLLLLLAVAAEVLVGVELVAEIAERAKRSMAPTFCIADTMVEERLAKVTR